MYDFEHDVNRTKKVIFLTTEVPIPPHQPHNIENIVLYYKDILYIITKA